MIFIKNDPLPVWLKRLLVIGGVLLVLAGLPMMFGYMCITLVLTLSEDHDAMQVGMVSFMLMAVTVGAGGIIFWHSWRSLQGKISRPMLLWPLWTLAAMFGLWLAMGLFIIENKIAPGLFFPPILLVAAVLPPLGAVSWFIKRRTEELTWRRGLVAFVGGATVSVAIAVILETLFPAIILALVFNLADTALHSIEQLVTAMAGKNIALAIASRGFIYIFIQIALIAPVVEELAKPLVTLPLLGRLSRRGAFLVGAMAGAGFATLENVLHAGFGLVFWGGILVIRAIGCAIHPLSAGLVAVGWHGVLQGETHSWRAWWGRFGLAVGLHAFWNGGSLLVITLAGTRFFGELPPEIDMLGLSAAGTTLALLLVGGLLTLWWGRSMVTWLGISPQQPSDGEVEFILSDRAIALWAMVFLVAVVPTGITGWQILAR